MKIVTVIGARPQFIKAAAVSRAIKKEPSIHEVIIHTGQHFDYNMSDIFFNEMEIPVPDYNLDIHGLNHGAMTGKMLEKIEEILLKEKPDIVIVYGDTNSTLAGSLSAAKLHVPVAHVEAGLRSFNMKMPEEINRILTDRISSLLFCPTSKAVENLLSEGYESFDTKIIKSGDVMQDAALYYAQFSQIKSEIIKKSSLKQFVICTLHRAENTDDESRLCSIISALEEINKSVPVVMPLHPRTRNRLKELSIKMKIEPIDPVGYFDMIELLKNCSLVMTDSGGLQKEAFFFQKNCLTLRDETEWVELVDNGFNLIVGAQHEKIIAGFETMLKRNNDFGIDLYGNGNASNIIVNELIHF